VLVVGGSSAFAARLFELPVAVTLLHWPSHDCSFEQSAVLRVLTCDLSNEQAVVARARQAHAARPVDGVISMTETALYPASVAAQEIGARANPAACIALAQDKAAMRERLADRGLDGIASRLCRDPAQVRDFAVGCPDGAILKPVAGNGGAGISLVRDPADVASAWEWTQNASGVLATAWEWPIAAPGDGSVLAEEYLPGPEFSVETLSVAGTHHLLAITAKHTTGPPHFFETGHDLPAPLAASESAALHRAATQALDAIGLRWGPAHTEVIRSRDRIIVVEINPRPGGARIWEMIGLVTGIDVVAASIATLAHGAWSIPGPAAALPGACGGTAIRMLTPRPGRVTAITGLDEALGLDGVLRIGDLPGIGGRVQPLTHGNYRAGYALGAAPDLRSAVAAADRAAATVTIHTAPDPAADGAATDSAAARSSRA
jgi:biotin carboxylase